MANRGYNEDGTEWSAEYSEWINNESWKPFHREFTSNNKMYDDVMLTRDIDLIVYLRLAHKIRPSLVTQYNPHSEFNIGDRLCALYDSNKEVKTTFKKFYNGDFDGHVSLKTFLECKELLMQQAVYDI